MAFRNGGELLVAQLRAAGVDTVFGVISIHNLPLVEAVAAAMRFVPVRHEAAAINAADGYGRARDGLGCALTSTGTGAGNAAGSLIEALTAGRALLHVTGQVPTGHLGHGRGFIHETKDQLGMLSAVSRRAVSITTSDQAPQVLAAAVRDAMSPPAGPVSVEWPIDLQYASISEDLPELPPPPRNEPDGDAIREAAALLSGANRPVVWAGGGSRRSGAALQALLERLGAGLFTSNAGRGAVPETHTLCIGNYATSTAGQLLLDDADVILSLGTHFRSNETHTYHLRLPATHIQVDLDPAAPGRVYPAKLSIVGDVEQTLQALLRSIDGSATEAGWGKRVHDTRAAARATQRATLGAQADFCDALRAALPGSSIIARDVTIPSSSWGNRLLPILDPRTNIFPHGGGIGQGLAMGIGAAVGRPDEHVVVLVGDGGLAVHLGELLTLAQERVRLTVLVFNDRGYGVLRNMQDAQGKERAGVDLFTPDFHGLAAATGLGYDLIRDVASAQPKLEAAFGADRPTLVEVDVEALGPMTELFVPPVEVPASVGEELP